MRLGKKEQAALLLVTYLRQNGQARLQDVSDSLSLPLHYLEQVARKLRIAGIVESYRGPGGGYRLFTDPTMHHILSAVGYQTMVTEEDLKDLRSRGQVGTLLASQLSGLSAALTESLSD